LSCAHALQAAGFKVHVFESSSSVGGRCATRLWQGHLVDVGVQYFTAQSPDFKKELLTRLRQFRPLTAPIFDQNDHIMESALGPRFYVLHGNNYLAHILARGLDVRLNTPVEKLSFSSSSIECLGEHYRAVVSSLPGPQTERLFELNQPPSEYDPCLIALLEYAGTGVGLSRECYARVLPDGREAILATYCENNKVGRIVGNKTVFVVQATSRFSRKHVEEPSEAYLSELSRKNAELWQIADGLCTARSIHCWPYGRPLKDKRHQGELPRGAFICGDSRADSTVEDVWLDGRKAATEVLNYLD
jgi:hypothetical protein